MNPDLLVTWPDTIDFPLFREWIHKYREHFNKVLIVWSQTNWEFTDLRSFIEKAMFWDNCTFIQSLSVENGQDWRNVAVRTGLNYTESEWIWFTEQDFFPNPNLFEELKKLPKSDIVGVTQDGRLHPCCIIIKRQVLDKTSKDFSANPPDHDHFGQIQKDLMNWNPPLTETIINPKFYTHMNGLTHNMFLLQSGKQPIYRVGDFGDYLLKCMKVTVPLHPEFVKLITKYLK